MKKCNAFYAQSGGVTSVINVTASAVINELWKQSAKIDKIYAGHNGILGAIREEMFDLTQESRENILKLMHTPGGAFGSCRYRLDKDSKEYERIIEVFAAHNINYFFYNGGNDSMDTANKIAIYSRDIGYPLSCIGIPKTIDNDLTITDSCPGFGSAAKFLATVLAEANQDVASMCATSTKIFVIEVMGRNSGWLAAATALASFGNDTPHLIIFPEVALEKEKFLSLVEEKVKTYGYCCITVSEGAKNIDGSFISASTSIIDSFGHQQLGGAAITICHDIKKQLGYKYHYAVVDYLQRSARHLASRIDVDHAYAVGKYAVEYALSGGNNKMIAIVRKSSKPYRWGIKAVPLSEVANKEKKLPQNFISADGFNITKDCYKYLHPLIQGEETTLYQNGLPSYAKLNKVFVDRKLSLV